MVLRLIVSRSDLVYDFDIMMQKKREENYRRRKRKNIDIINDSDDVIAEMISQMKQAAEVSFLPKLHVSVPNTSSFRTTLIATRNRRQLCAN